MRNSIFDLAIRHIFCFISFYALFAAAQLSTSYTLTTSVSSPPVTPGKPFAITWTGGTSDSVVFLVLTYFFPNTPNQLVPYGKTDILSNAPNNGSWTWNVPTDILPGRYQISIGDNPLLQSSSTGVFTIDASQVTLASTTALPATGSVGINTLYNGCGLAPLPDYTFTGYQPPCVLVTNGQTSTLYPVVPADSSSRFFSSGGEFATRTERETLTALFPGYSSAAATPTNTATSTGGTPGSSASTRLASSSGTSVPGNGASGLSSMGTCRVLGLLVPAVLLPVVIFGGVI